jgi:hypothetical protein
LVCTERRRAPDRTARLGVERLVLRFTPNRMPKSKVTRTTAVERASGPRRVKLRAREVLPRRYAAEALQIRGPTLPAHGQIGFAHMPIEMTRRTARPQEGVLVIASTHKTRHRGGTSPETPLHVPKRRLPRS